jgi:disulfide bond formation protein DsbB
MTNTAQAVKSDGLAINDGATLSLVAAWLLALVASLAALFIGEIMGQAPCVLCWYQRAAMFPLALLLGIAAWRGDFGIWRYALPVAGIGLLISVFHTMLYFGLIPQGFEPCDAGVSCTEAEMTVFGLAIPALSIAAFAGVSFFLLQARRGDRQ